MSEVSYDEDLAREISSAEQDRRWGAPKLIGLGAITLLFAIAAIYLAADLIGQ